MDGNNSKTVYVVTYASVGTEYAQCEDDLYTEVLKVFDNFNDAMQYVSKELPEFTGYKGDEDCMEATIKDKWKIRTVRTEYVK